MSTARDLMIVALDAESGGASGRNVERGDVSLALAAAEAIDLLAAGSVRLADGCVVPDGGPPAGDPRLAEASAAVLREAPFEPVGDWLWRRGRDLAAAYVEALEAEGTLTRPRSFWSAFRTTRAVLVDSPERRAAQERRATGDPVLAARAETAGIGDERTRAADRVTDDDAALVLSALEDAVTELKFQRHRRALDQAAFDNVWRGD